MGGVAFVETGPETERVVTTGGVEGPMFLAAVGPGFGFAIVCRIVNCGVVLVRGILDFADDGFGDVPGEGCAELLALLMMSFKACPFCTVCHGDADLEATSASARAICSCCIWSIFLRSFCDILRAAAGAGVVKGDVFADAS